MADPVFAPRRLNSAAFEMKRKASFSKLDFGASVPRGTAALYADSENVTVSDTQDRMWKLMDMHLASDRSTIQRAVVNHVEYTLAKNRFTMDSASCYRASAYSIRDRLIGMLKDTSSFFFKRDVKRCYYLSLEFLVGRAMQNALVNLDLEDQYRDALGELGYRLEELYEYEHDAALGNGGLGRLAACYLDAMATCNFAGWGYGIRYTYGIFEQKIINGWQCEYPDYWLVQDNPWEVCRQDVTYAVRFGGSVKEYTDSKGRQRVKWVGGQIVQAIAYDNPIPGFDTFNCINLRLWRAAPSKEFDFQSFNSGRYLEAIRERQDAECISAVLYPNDSTDEGKELRLKQQYFFCCASVQDMLRRFTKKGDREWADFPKKVAVQLNDTHPTIAIPELIRILVDVECLEWNQAVDITRQTFAYTNHTVLPEALEKWPVGLFEKLLPRHVQIINEMNFRFLNEVRTVWGDNYEKISKMSFYEEGWTKQIRMANIAVVGCHSVNGVAAIHSGLVKRDLFPEMYEFYKAKGQPNKFKNITNGVTVRRWVHNCNRKLSDLISNRLGSDGWLKSYDLVAGLINHIDDPTFLKEWADMKLKNKERLAKWISLQGGPEVDPAKMLFDVQVKRIHEYKRQQLNAFYMIHRYLAIKKMSSADRAHKILPRCTMVGGKAAPGYTTAKTIIKMINCIADLVNNDPDVSPYYRVYFLPNYNVSSAAIIMPGADINQQISTAGMEASGTSNMKFVMNGSLIIGTMDGANIEIIEEGGRETAFIFGATEPEVAGVRSKARAGVYPIDPRLWEVFNFIRSGKLCKGDSNASAQICELIDKLLNNKDGHNGDYYLVCHDFRDYCRAQDDVDKCYQDPVEWAKKSIRAAASMGKFSADRSIMEYADKVWNIMPSELAPPAPETLRRLASGAGNTTRSHSPRKETPSPQTKTHMSQNQNENVSPNPISQVTSDA